jgi:hypothetical protein
MRYRGGTNHVLKPLPIIRNILEKNSDEKLEKIIGLEKFSFAMTTRFKMKNI